MNIIKLIAYNIKDSAIAAASSLLIFGEKLYLCCDDQYTLFELDSNNLWHKHHWADAPILPTKSEERKKLKPDYEVLMNSYTNSSSLILFPSGSKDNRTLALEYDLALKSFRSIDLTNFFLELREREKLINIEGGILLNDHFLLLNRGIGDHLSSLISVDAKNFIPIFNQNIDFGKFKDGYLHGSELYLYDGHLYALAVAEKSTNSYDDGEILGSGIFKISLNKFEILEAWHFDRPIKAEGLCRFRGKWLIATDPDGEGLSEFFQFNL